MKRMFLFAIASIFMLFSIYADDKILSPNISQKKIYPIYEKGWLDSR